MKRKSLPTGRDFLFVEGYGNENPGAFQSPRPLRGATALPFRAYALVIFQPTRPLRGATIIECDKIIEMCNFNPRAPCGARLHISLFMFCIVLYFNPRAPCGARLNNIEQIVNQIKFQPTRPLRGATVSVRSLADARIRNFNPRAPCGARLAAKEAAVAQSEISTHAPLAGRDALPAQKFQSPS